MRAWEDELILDDLAGGTMAEREDSVHVPVLAEEVVALLGGGRDAAELDGWIVDATLGAGGHSALLLERFPRVRVLGIDQDPEILTVARGRLEPFSDRVCIERCRMSGLSRLLRKLRLAHPVGVLIDAGASSLQLDRADRGFSFAWDGPLDMRMDPERSRTAAEIVNNWDEADLADLFHHEGGERQARRIAREIVRRRRQAPFLRTLALADLVARSTSAAGRLHPATKVFQALRRAVNEEGEELQAGLAAAELWLPEGGVLVAISFHSGEDGEVKRFLATGARAGRWEVSRRKPVRPTREEALANRRSRSARLRSATRRADDENPARTRTGLSHESGDREEREP